MIYRLGHIADKPDERDFRALDHALIGAAPKLSVVSVRDYVPEIYDQGSAGSCVWQVIATLLSVDARRQGIDLPPVSRLAGYANSRPLPLSDDGCQPRVAISNAHKFGIVAETRWPYDVSKVNDDVPYDVFQHGADAKIDAYYAITGTGQARLDQIDQALAAGFAVGWATQVDGLWDSYDGVGEIGDYDGSPTRGGHYTTIVGKDSAGWYDVLNSWGTGWGLGGFARVSAGRIASAISTDFRVVQLAPRGVS